MRGTGVPAVGGGLRGTRWAVRGSGFPILREDRYLMRGLPRGPAQVNRFQLFGEALLFYLKEKQKGEWRVLEYYIADQGNWGTPICVLSFSWPPPGPRVEWSPRSPSGSGGV
jgi:hypothetical protein